MSTVTSYSLMSRPAPAPTGVWLGSWKSAAVAFPPSTPDKAPGALRPVCPADGQACTQHPPTALVHPEPPPEDENRWSIKEDTVTNKVTLWVQVPGLSKDDLEVKIDEDVLAIKKKDSTPGATEADKHGVGALHARLLIPGGYDKGSVEAELQDGVLKVTISKTKSVVRRNITVEIKLKNSPK